MTEQTGRCDASVRTASYRFAIEPDGRFALVSSARGDRLVRLCLIGAIDTTRAPDETLGLDPPERVDAPAGAIAAFCLRRSSSIWESASALVTCHEDHVAIRHEVTGKGSLTTLLLGGGRSVIGQVTGLLHSGTTLGRLFSPNPGDPSRLVRQAGEPAVIGVCGDSLPGRGHWFFTPAPLCFALSSSEPNDAPGRRAWLGISLREHVGALTCTELAWVPADQGFHLALDYEGHTEVTGRFATPALVLSPGAPSPIAALEAHREDLARSGMIATSERRAVPSWWRRPMFCGWGAQCYAASRDGTRPQDHCSQKAYDGYLDALWRQGVVPGTIVIDDGWQAHYGRPEPGPGWETLREWIAERHAMGQKVLLWWKAWDPDGLPMDWCITNANGVPVAIDPTHPALGAALCQSMTAMLTNAGLDADGLKVDFTARTPSGRALFSHAKGWGIALLHDYLAQLYRAAKAAKPDALVITHTPNPLFGDVSDMIRLNDELRLDDERPQVRLVDQMRYRAAVARAACPDLLIDTDDWCAPDLAQWREYLLAKPAIGVPALYYSTHLDKTGEALGAEDYAALRALFADADARAGFSLPPKEPRS